MIGIAMADVGARNLGDGPRAALLHHQFEFYAHQVEDALHPGLAEGRQPPDIGAADAHGLGPEGQSFEDIRTTPEAAINKYRDFVSGCLDYFRQTVDSPS